MIRVLAIIAVALVAAWLLHREVRYLAHKDHELDQDILAQLRDHQSTAASRRS